MIVEEVFSNLICWIVGAVFGFFISALFAANKD